MFIPDVMRKGKFSHASDWKKQYEERICSAEEAAMAVRNGDVVSMTGGANFPAAFVTALCKRAAAENFCDLKFIAPFNLRTDFEYAKAEYKEFISSSSYFFGAERVFAKQGNFQFVPIHLGQTCDYLSARKPHVVSITCSPPDENGWMSRSLWGAHLCRDAYQSPDCRVLVITINRDMPFLNSEGERHLLTHVSEADFILEDNHELPEIGSIDSSDTDKRIADYIAEMIDDGACLQFGQGSLADAIGNNLVYAKKKDLGLQSEVVSNCVANLMKQGVINNSRKKTFRGKSLSSYVVGDRTLWDYCHLNEDFVFTEIDFVNKAANICQNDNVVSINNAMTIDLTGQVSSESIGPVQYTGSGGQLEWVYGSQLSKNGKSIIAINSAYRDKNGQMQSKIMPALPLGSIVTTPRTCVQYVVTEFGVANLKFKGVRDRVEALIGIAHPDFRSELRFEAKQQGLL